MNNNWREKGGFREPSPIREPGTSYSERFMYEWKQVKVKYFCKDHRNKKDVPPDPMAKDLTSDKIWKRNKSKANLTVVNLFESNISKAQPFLSRVLQIMTLKAKTRYNIKWGKYTI